MLLTDSFCYGPFGRMVLYGMQCAQSPTCILYIINRISMPMSVTGRVNMDGSSSSDIAVLFVNFIRGSACTFQNNENNRVAGTCNPLRTF